MNRIFVPLSAAMLVVLVPLASARQNAPAREGRIAYISTQRILAESSDARAELARFQTMQQQKAVDLRAKQQALENTRRQLAAASDSARRTELQRQEEQQRAELERALALAQTDLQASQREVQSALRALLKPVLDDLMKGRDTDLVLNADTSIVWSAPGLDLTATVVERLNARQKASAPRP